jgi:hypothetical protein
MRVAIARALIAIALAVKWWLGIVAWIMPRGPGLVGIRTLIGIRNRMAGSRVGVARVRRAWILVAVVVAGRRRRPPIRRRFLWIALALTDEARKLT